MTQQIKVFFMQEVRDCWDCKYYHCDGYNGTEECVHEQAYGMDLSPLYEGFHPDCPILKEMNTSLDTPTKA